MPDENLLGLQHLAPASLSCMQTARSAVNFEAQIAADNISKHTDFLEEITCSYVSLVQMNVAET